MIPAGMVITWLGYAVSSWGYCLLKGYDITFRHWVSPLHPYTWPKSGDPPKIPPTSVLPGATAKAARAARKTTPGKGGVPEQPA